MRAIALQNSLFYERPPAACTNESKIKPKRNEKHKVEEGPAGAACSRGPCLPAAAAASDCASVIITHAAITKHTPQVFCANQSTLLRASASRPAFLGKRHLGLDCSLVAAPKA